MMLERLEDRTVPSAGFNVLGPPNNPTVNAALPSTGLSIATTPGQVIGSSPFPTTGATGLNGQFGLLVGSAAVNSLGLADASVRLFASSAVNSLGLFNQTVPAFAPDAYGFGSGTQPGAPWAPAAYNVGLANQQTTYLSISDHGYQATPPWVRNIHKHIKESAPAPDEQQAVEDDLIPIANQENDADVPRKTYRLVSPEQVLDEVEDQATPNDEGRGKEPTATLPFNLAPAAFGSQRLQAFEQVYDPVVPSFREENSVKGRPEALLEETSFADGLSVSVPAANEMGSAKIIASDQQNQFGLVNLDGENNVPSLEAVSLTEFPTLSRMILLPALSTLLMELPLPALRIDSTAENLERSLPLFSGGVKSKP